MFTLAIGIIKVMTFISFVMVGAFILLELLTRSLATKWEDLDKPHLQVVREKASKVRKTK